MAKDITKFTPYSFQYTQLPELLKRCASMVCDKACDSSFHHLYLIMWLYLNLSICTQLLKSFGHYILSYWWGKQPCFKWAGSISKFRMKFHHLLGKGKNHLPDERQRCITSQKPWTFSNTTVRTSNVTCYFRIIKFRIYHRHYKYNMVTRYVSSFCLNYVLT
jgi:hypothetical protein